MDSSNAVERKSNLKCTSFCFLILMHYFYEQTDSFPIETVERAGVAKPTR